MRGFGWLTETSSTASSPRPNSNHMKSWSSSVCRSIASIFRTSVRSFGSVTRPSAFISIAPRRASLSSCARYAFCGERWPCHADHSTEALHGVLLGRLLEDLRDARHAVAVAREQDEQRERDRHAEQQVEDPAAFGLVALAQGVGLVGPDALLVQDAFEARLAGRDGGRHGVGREQDRALDVRERRHVVHVVPDRLRVHERDLAVQRPVAEGAHLAARERRLPDVEDDALVRMALRGRRSVPSPSDRAGGP